jgi:hypothetical protein
MLTIPLKRTELFISHRKVKYRRIVFILLSIVLLSLIVAVEKTINFKFEAINFEYIKNNSSPGLLILAISYIYLNLSKKKVL